MTTDLAMGQVVVAAVPSRKERDVPFSSTLPSRSEIAIHPAQAIALQVCSE